MSGDKQLVTLILQSAPLNRCRRRRHNKMTSLKERQSKLKRWKTMWKMWWKYSCINLRKSPHRSTHIWCFGLFSHMIHVHHHLFTESVYIFFLSTDQLLHLRQQTLFFKRYFDISFKFPASVSIQDFLGTNWKFVIGVIGCYRSTMLNFKGL